MKGNLPPKYINHKTGETWSGHARPPAWIKDVKDRSRFLIAGGVNTAVAASADAVSKARMLPKKLWQPRAQLLTRGSRRGRSRPK
ncbi:H-NS family nucleoid-associated regulatory protein [Paraburkholderia sp. GAS448]|uniref:H-NS family nucleoid-associated regulatory protein n=1 Tax=Paraburkholderia sp. GAS448 TaxID=3035136 RepID=UPI003D19F73A